MNFETLTNYDLREIVKKFHESPTLFGDSVEILISARTEQKRRENKNYEPRCPVNTQS